MPTETFFNLPQDKRDKIVEVAFHEFGARQYESVSITNIVNKSNIAKGSFYQYFADKKDLYFYLLDLVAKAKLEFMSTRIGESPGDFFEMFRYMVILGAEFAISFPNYNAFGARVMENPLKDETFTRLKIMTAQAYEGMIRQGQAAGQVRDDVPVEMLVLFMNGISVDFGQYMADRAGLEFGDLITEENIRKLDVPRIADDLVKILMSGMSASKTLD